MEFGYFGVTFDRTPNVTLPWIQEGSEPNADMYALPSESREFIVSLYRQAWAHSDSTIQELSLESIGHVPWWPREHNEVTLHRVQVHMLAETNRHAGHADIVRELIDESAGFKADDSNMPDPDRQWWTGYRAKVEQAAREA